MIAPEEDARLCYVEGDWAYFTTLPLDRQCGDDWNDAPYYDNAGLPYDYRPDLAAKGVTPWRIIKIAIHGGFYTPRDVCKSLDLSVDSINKGAAPWITFGRFCKGKLTHLYAGATVAQVKAEARRHGHAVFVEEPNPLLPCPLCGGPAECVQINPDLPNGSRDTMYHVQCKTRECGVRTRDWYPELAALSSWNRRPHPTPARSAP